MEKISKQLNFKTRTKLYGLYVRNRKKFHFKSFELFLAKNINYINNKNK